MESLKELFKIGMGPSSSHTMGPSAAAKDFKERTTCQTAQYKVTLYGSLAATGKGHLTDSAILQVFGKEATHIDWKPDITLSHHPNAMKFESFTDQGKPLCSGYYFSIGGGSIEGPFDHDFPASDTVAETKSLYPYATMREIVPYLEDKHLSYFDYVIDNDEEDLYSYLQHVWSVMEDAIDRGMKATGFLPGPLHLKRKAASFAQNREKFHNILGHISEPFPYALAVSEENASGGVVVTAPTCGSCGILPAVLKLFQEKYQFSENRIIRALAVGGLFGNIVKTNGSISGAAVGCQGEVGVACAMAAASATYLLGGSLRQIEAAAEIGLEHHLGLTCDPVLGLVQVPCIERNAIATTRALEAASYALLSDGIHIINYDEVIKTMVQTGHDLNSNYRETACGGLAKYYQLCAAI